MKGAALHPIARFLVPVQHPDEGSLAFQRREALHVVLLVVLAITTVLTVVTWAVDYVATFYTTLLMTVYTLVCLTLNRKGRRRWAAGMLCLGLMVIIEVNSFFGEGIHDIIMLALPSVIVIAGLLYGRQSIPLFTALSLVTLVLSAALPYRNQIYGEHIDDSIIGSILLVGIGSLVYFITSRLEKHIERVQQSQKEVASAYEATLEGWAKALELRDRETEGHSRMVTELTVKLATRLGIRDKSALANLRFGVLLHDIGKIGIPDSILLKRGSLTEEEWQVMKQHPVIAASLLAHIPYLKEANDIVQYHHERWDGSGYPKGLCGAQIPLSARIFAIIDNYEALGADRPYRPAWPHQEVLDFLKQSAGTLFDPSLVRIFLDMLEEEHAYIY